MEPVRRRLLGAMLVAFAGRVSAQVLQRFAPVSWLPSFENWQSGSLPYPVLFGLQVVLLAIMVAIVSSGRAVPERHRRTVSGFGLLYLVAMIVRLFVGLTVADGHSFLDRPIPSLFHILLASFVLVWASPVARQSVPT